MKSSKCIEYDEIQLPSKQASVTIWHYPRSLIKQIPTSQTLLQGHRDSVNALRFNADLTFLLSGGTLFYSPILIIVTEYLDNSGLIVVWDLALRAPFQQIDASCAGSVTFICWINLLKNITPGEDDPAPAFAVGFGTGTIAIYRQTSENVSLWPLLLCTKFFSWLSPYLNSSKTLKPMMGQLRISPSIGAFWGLLVPGLATRKSGTCVCPSIP